MFIWRKLLTTLYERSVYAAITFCESVWFMIFPLLEIVIKTTAREKRNKLQYEMVNGWLKWVIYFSDTWQKSFFHDERKHWNSSSTFISDFLCKVWFLANGLKMRFYQLWSSFRYIYCANITVMQQKYCFSKVVKKCQRWFI